MADNVDELLRRRSRRHVFGVFRRPVPRYVIPLWLAFGCVDWVYQPQLLGQWLALRVACAVVWLAARLALRHPRVRRAHFEWLAWGASVTAASTINVMIAQSGGSGSGYVPGIILTVVSCILLFRLDRLHAWLLGLCAYGPCVVILWTFGAESSWRSATVASSLVVGMMILTLIFRTSDSSVQLLWAKAKVDVDRDLRKVRRTEFLKRHFPKEIREEIESGRLDIVRKQILPFAVIGFADISGSTEIANTVDLNTDWELKERFLLAATQRATQCGLVVLTHTGDGFLFLANYFSRDEWTYNLVSFYEGLQRDWEQIKIGLEERTGPLTSGIKCAVATGPAILGFIGGDQAYFTVMGPTVNLAARLCDKAHKNEIVVSSRVWDVLRHILVGWETNERRYESLKGFDRAIGAIHITPRTSAKRKKVCPTCNASLSVVRTPEGFIDIRCPNGHPPVAHAAA